MWPVDKSLRFLHIRGLQIESTYYCIGAHITPGIPVVSKSNTYFFHVMSIIMYRTVESFDSTWLCCCCRCFELLFHRSLLKARTWCHSVFNFFLFKKTIQIYGHLKWAFDFWQSQIFEGSDQISHFKLLTNCQTFVSLGR